MRSGTWKRTGMVALVVSVVSAPVVAAEGAAALDTPPVNQWATVHDQPPGIIGIHARFLWLPGMKRGFLWPNVNYRARAFTVKDHDQIYFFAPGDGQWSVEPSTFPEGLRPYPEMVGTSYVYLPGLKRILLLMPGGDSRRRTHANSWLLDPAAAAWEAVGGDLRMCDRSADFNPAKGRDGAPVPLWGVLCYDAHNREAVSIAGGGTWGRVGKAKEMAAVGDWIYDETTDPKRIRRLTPADKGTVAEARKWYPANCGTWAFSEKTKTWSPIGQALAQQPSGRILPGAAYDAGERKIVLFGGDDYQRCLSDTWVYDCATRTWSKVKPTTSPPARAACAMAYVPDQKVVLMVGGYGPGWRALNDVWMYETAGNTWTKLAIDVPTSAMYYSAAYRPDTKAVILSVSQPSWGRNKKTLLYGLHLEAASVGKAPAPAKIDPRLEYHARASKRWGEPMPEDWLSAKNTPGDVGAGRNELKSLPANTWVIRQPPIKTRARQWGSYVYDVRTHKGYAWGGGHYGYIGADVAEYDVLTNRWMGMADPVNYKLPWRHPSGGGSPGVSFQGWVLMGTHARKSYAVDPLTDTVITLHGDVYSIKDRMYVANIGRCPGRYSAATQAAFVATPHGVYGYHDKDGGALHRANVAAGTWDLVAKGGPKPHHEYSHMCYDSKRNRLVYFYHVSPKVWTFDFTSKEWSEEKVENTGPAGALGNSTYVPELDAALLLFSADRKTDDAKLYFYKLDDRRWYTAPYTGQKFGSYGTLNNSTHYDPELKLAVRITHQNRERAIEVLVMRLDLEALKLTPME